MRQSIPSANLQKTKLGGMADILEGCAVFHRDLEWQEKWTNRSLIKFNREKCKVLQLGRNNTPHQYRLGPPSWEAALQKRPRGPGGHQAECEAATCPYCKES